jgi:hypothetical protein
MSNFFFLIIFFPIALVIAILFDRIFQSPKDYRREIENDLTRSGYKLIDIQIPKLFETGPFPKFESKIYMFGERLGPINGDKTRFRIIKYRDQNGTEKSTWIKIELKNFKIFAITWSPSL